MKCFYVLILVLWNYFYCDAASSFSFPITGIFNRYTEKNSLQAYENVLKMRSIYNGDPINSQVTDSYSTALEVCKKTSGGNGVIALVDARATFGECDIVCLLCNRYNITHLSLGWETPSTIDSDLFTISYHPAPDLVSKAYAALIQDLQWDHFTIFYENDDSFTRVQDIINTWPYNMEPILYQRLDPNEDNRETFKYVFKVARLTSHIIDCDVKNIKKYMREIVQVENSTHFQSFILTALDSYKLSFEDIPNLLANVSTLHLTNKNEDGWKDLNLNSNNNNNSITVETALAADALNHLEAAIRTMQSHSENLQETITNPPALCFQNSRIEYEALAWPMGNNLREALLTTTSKGFTGNIEFDEFGKRTNLILHYSKLDSNSRFSYVGSWDSTTNVVKKENIVSERSIAYRSNSVVRVVSRKGEPYFSIHEVNGTTVYKGYAVDLIDKIFQYINKKPNISMQYEFYRVSGDAYGNPIAGTKKWNGLIGELLNYNAALAICDITITSERNSVVDFSTPFMSLGISMLTKAPEPQEPDKFSFIKPLDWDVWLYLAVAYIIVSFILLICARMNEGDWVNPHPCNQNPESLQNIWNLKNCTWLTMGAIMTQGCDILPRGLASRIVTGIWWFFALIVTSSYTANMSTFLSDSRRSNEIKSVKELAEQTKISYGAMYNTSTYKFFENSKDKVYSKLWSTMNSAKPRVFTTNNEEGRDRVLKSKGTYVFFMESTSIDYYTQRNCQLKMVGQPLDSKHYGIAMPYRSPLKNLVDEAILDMQQHGELDKLKSKWWDATDHGVDCETQKSEDDEGSLQMKNTSGIFLVLAFGAFLGIVVAIIDFLMHSHQIAVKEKITFKEAMSSEWRASLNPRTLHKPAAPPRSTAPSTRSPTPNGERSQSRAVSVLRAATSFINFDEIY